MVSFGEHTACCYPFGILFLKFSAHKCPCARHEMIQTSPRSGIGVIMYFSMSLKNNNNKKNPLQKKKNIISNQIIINEGMKFNTS